MKTKMKVWKTAALAAGLGMLAVVARPAQAQAATTDSLTVTITPSASYAVSIATGASGANLGTVSVGGSTQTVSPSTVTITSSYAYTGLTLQGAITSPGGTAWSFVTTSSATSLDTLAAWAVFTDTGISAGSSLTTGVTFGSGNYWVGVSSGASSNMIGTTNAQVGGSGNSCPGTQNTANSRFVVGSSSTAGYKNMDCLKPSSVDAGLAASHLWLGFKMPTATTSTTAQLVTLTLTAGAPN